jgi:hypothetical protein
MRDAMLAREQGWTNLSRPQRRPARRWRLSAPARQVSPAQQPRARGHDVHVYERYAAGGLLRYGIPDFKMEKDPVDMRVAQMEAEVHFHYGADVGVNVPVTELTPTTRSRSPAPKNHAICQLRAVSSTASISRWIFCRSRIAASAANRWATWLPFWPRTNASS